MRKIILLIATMLLILCGCGNETPVLESADFSFPMPEGYSIAYVENFNCSIQRDRDCVAVGGMEAVPLSGKALTEKNATGILNYLQTQFHQTNDVEFITFHWEEPTTIVSIDMRVHHEDGSEAMFSHFFFEQDGLVYHLWLDTDNLGEADPGDFLSSALS